MGGLLLTLIDDDTRRRAAISHALSAGGLHVEPFEHLAEMLPRWPGHGVLLIHDRDDAIAVLIEHMGRSGTWLPIVAFAAEPHPRRVVRAVARGAADYLAWPFGADEAREVAARASAGSLAQASAALRAAMARGRLRRLTPRESEVLAALSEGLTNQGIADRLAISGRTVEVHRANAVDKLGVAHTAQAIRIAIEASLAEG